MCIDSDLFGDVIVTKKDVDFWLDHVARMHGRTKSARESYAKHYEVANKIKQSKLSGEFEKLISKLKDDSQYNEQPLDYYATKYAAPWARKPCPEYSHKCAFMDCPIFLKWRKKHYDQQRYIARKKAALLAA